MPNILKEVPVLRPLAETVRRLCGRDKTTTAIHMIDRVLAEEALGDREHPAAHPGPVPRGPCRAG